MHTSRFKRSFFLIFSVFFIFALICPVAAYELSSGEKQLLDRIERDSIKYFFEQSPIKTGLTKDSSRSGSPCSIAAVGFYLASIVIALENHWITKKKAYNRIKTVFHTLSRKAEHKNGFYYHFVDPDTGKRAWGSEASSIDTALLMAGVLVAGESFKRTSLHRKAQQLYERVDWKWMQNNTDMLSHGWKPETGFLPHYWDSYSELLILMALALGSPTNPADREVWDCWTRYEENYKGNPIVYCLNGTLFVYQYSHAFIDFKGLDDKGIDYFRNSQWASRANYDFCKENAEKYETYRNSLWGLSASLGPKGYKAYGAQPGNPLHDGTIAPYGAISSIVFTPELSIPAIKEMYSKHKNRLYGRYGFKGAFNLDQKWFAREFLAIDQGITALMIENFKTGLIWKLFMQTEAAQNWIKKCNLKK